MSQPAAVRLGIMTQEEFNEYIALLTDINVHIDQLVKEGKLPVDTPRIEI